jgi:hypothetical protein
MSKTDVRNYIDNAIQNYAISANAYNAVLDEATNRAWAQVDTVDDLVGLDIGALIEDLY